MNLIRAAERGQTQRKWLDSKHSFSFGEYYDPNKLGFRALRVINEDWILPSKGFPSHPHNDMEILTYVMSGKLAHKDSMGNGSVINAGEFQKMTAGKGVTHSEYNASSDETCHLYQVWIQPKEKGLEPTYQEKSFDDDLPANSFLPVLSPTGRDGSMTIHQNAELHLGIFNEGNAISFVADSSYSHAFIQVVEGVVKFDSYELHAGDGLSWELAGVRSAMALSHSKLLLFYLS